jgi:hypothetical protein
MMLPNVDPADKTRKKPNIPFEIFPMAAPLNDEFLTDS